MMWGRNKRRKHAQDDADEAVRKSVMEWHGAVRGGAEARRLAQRLREIQRHNNFGPSIADVYSGEKSS